MRTWPPILLPLCLVALLTACIPSGPTPAARQPTEMPSPTSVPATVTSTRAPTTTPSPTVVTPSPTTAPPSPTAEPISAARALARGTASQRLIAVMLDNHPAAYPQTGMDSAVVVFEALAEYGLTRYMAIYAPGISPEAPEIGAVRSARAYFVEWAMGFAAVFVHAGGSPDSLVLAETATEIVNLDALRSETATSFYRSDEREAPHNLYTSSALLQEFVADADAAGFDPDAHGFLFKPDTPAERRPDAQRISYYFLYDDDPAGWIYDRETNGYLRLRRDRPHIDGRTGEQLWFKNVVVMEVPQALVPGDDAGRIALPVVGEGRARLFADGFEREMEWRKPAPAAPLRFYDVTGEEVRFNAGPVWIAALPALERLTVE